MLGPQGQGVNIARFKDHQPRSKTPVAPYDPHNILVESEFAIPDEYSKS